MAHKQQEYNKQEEYIAVACYIVILLYSFQHLQHYTKDCGVQTTGI